MKQFQADSWEDGRQQIEWTSSSKHIKQGALPIETGLMGLGDCAATRWVQSIGPGPMRPAHWVPSNNSPNASSVRRSLSA